MNKAVEHFENQLSGIHYGIPTAGLIDTIKVNYHGQLTPIQYLASTQPGEGRIKVEPYDPTILGIIEKTLVAAGFNAYVFSKTAVVVSLPKMNTAEERDKVINQMRKLEEEAKIVVRNVRKKIRQKLSQEELKKEEKQLQESTDKYISKIAEIANRKILSLTRR